MSPRRPDPASVFVRIGPGGGGGQMRPLVSPHDPDVVFIACDMTGWYQSVDGGESWRNVNLRGVVYSAAFDPSGPNVIYAGGSGLFRSRDAGRTWHLVFPDAAKVTAHQELGDHARHRYVSEDNWPGGLVLGIAADPADPNRLHAAILRPPEDGAELVLFSSADGGASFARLAGLGPDDHGGRAGDNHAVRAFLVDPDSGPDDRRLLLITPGGIRRVAVATGRVETVPLPEGAESIEHAAVSRDARTGAAVIYLTAPTRWAAGGKLAGGVYRSGDGGATWRQVHNGLLEGLHRPGTGDPPRFTCIAASPADCDVAYLECRNHRERPDGEAVYGHPFGVFKTTDGGASWSWCYRSAWDERPLNLTREGWLPHWLGTGWGGSAIHLAVAPNDPDVVWRVTAMCSSRSTDGAATWQDTYCRWRGDGSVTTNGMDVTTCYGVHVDPHVPRRVFITYTDISLFRSDDGGGGWWLAKGGIPNEWRNTCYWMVFDPEVRDRMWSVWSGCHDLPRPKMFGGDWSRRRGGVAFSGDGGRSWHPTTAGMPDHAVPTHILLAPDSPAGMRTLYVAAFNDGVYRSDNDGRSWRACNEGIDPSNRYAWRLARAADGTLYLCVARGGREDADYVDGAVYASDDRAGSWRPVPLPAGVNAPNDLAVDPRDPARLYLACWPRADADADGPAGGLWASDDAGRTWTPLLDQDLHAYAVTIDPRRPDRLYVCGFNSSIFRSDDRGKSWRRLGGYNFKWGHRVVCDPNDERLIYVTTFGGSVFHGPADGTGAAFEDIRPPEAEA